MATKNATGSDLTLMSVMARFSTEEAARAYFEGVRWANGRSCPHCGNADESRIYALTANRAAKIRPGMYKCAECQDTFTVTVGTVMEDSHIPLNKWLIAFYMMCASKTQVSALQLMRQLEIGSYHSALFLCHRMRFALTDIFGTFYIPHIACSTMKLLNLSWQKQASSPNGLAKRHAQVDILFHGTLCRLATISPW